MAVVHFPSSSELLCSRAGTPGDLAEHLAVRHAVFVEEQALFTGTDRDGHDDDPRTHHVVGYVDGVPAGAVRLYPVRGGVWKGDRLAVLHAYRKSGLGAPLVRHAVAAAAELGGTRMVAHVQVANVVFFRRLGWTAEGPPRRYVGVPHQRMSIPLC